MRLLLGLLLVTGLMASAPSAGPALAQSGDALVVGASGSYASLAQALATAPDGAVIEVHGGVHPGPLTVDRPLTLVGVDWPVIDGGGSGTVLTVRGAGTTVRGFLIRNSGASLDQENSGVVVEAPGVVIEGNRLEDALFGIYLRRAPGSVLRGNVIVGKELDLPRRGDAIRVWYSDDVVIEGNRISNGRDVVLWYSERLAIRDNRVTGGRYGLHFMYCDDALIQNNLLANNSVGAFLMYSRRLHMVGNTVAHNRGPSGYGVGLKDLDDAVVEDNIFADNRIGAHVDNSPREIDSSLLFQGNVFAYNDAGVRLMPSVRRNRFTRNGFIDNQEQVSVGGGGTVAANHWSVGDAGNYWSDYAGYDVGGDGVGDIPYKSERFFEDLAGRHPEMRLFANSLSTQALDFAARAVPFFRPEPKLTDPQPLMAPQVPVGLPTPKASSARTLGAASAGLLVLALGLLRLGRAPSARASAADDGCARNEWPMVAGVAVRGLVKRFGSYVAVDNLSFAVEPGKALALWGPNGSGKTTTLRCLLGVTRYQGSIEIGGIEMRHDGKAARRLVGFVPQELAFHDDLTVLETMRFYARLKKADPRVIAGLLERLGLGGQADKRIRHLSGGTKQRLALALALLTDPPVLVLDEPTASLDARSRADFLSLLRELKSNGKALVFASHRFGDIAELADRVLVLEGGRLVQDGAPAEVAGRGERMPVLRIRVRDDHIPRALDVLAGQGFSASRNGAGIKVQVAPADKARPFRLLDAAGVPVDDFDLDMGTGWED